MGNLFALKTFETFLVIPTVKLLVNRTIFNLLYLFFLGKLQKNCYLFITYPPRGSGRINKKQI